MRTNLSVLQTAKPADVRLDPFPYLVLHDALPEPLYRELVASRPSEALLGIPGTVNNKRWDYGTARILYNRNIPDLWKAFIYYHVSKEFFEEIADLFYEGIHRYYPADYPSRESLHRLQVGIRKIHRFQEFDVLMDAQISGNTPVREPTSVRKTHIDIGNKLFSGLLYMREEGDRSIGGDLEICRYVAGLDSLEAKQACFTEEYIREDAVEVVETVPYARNTLVLFINSLDSLHGVTVRQRTPDSRRFVNLIGEVAKPLYYLVKGRPTYARRQDVAEGVF